MDELVDLFDIIGIDLSSLITEYQTAKHPERDTRSSNNWLWWDQGKFIDKARRLLTDIHQVLNGPNMKIHPMYDDFRVLQLEDEVDQVYRKLDKLSFYQIQRNRNQLFEYVYERINYFARKLKEAKDEKTTDS